MYARTASLLALPIVLALASCASARGDLAPPPGVDLSGTWILDRRASATLESAMAERPRVTRRSPGAAGGGGGGRMVRREDVHGDMATLADAPERLILVQTDTSVTLRSVGSRLVAVVPITGRRTTITWLDGEPIQVRADWRDGDLRIERRLENASAVDTYSRDRGSDRLVVTTTLSGGMGGDFTLERLYALEADSAAH